VALRFLEQQNIIPIPRTSKRERLAENLGSLDFARLILAEQLGRRIGELM
jgi:diketogulonate reductase-like aldo/keto reductase